jgi:hypothetical protein
MSGETKGTTHNGSSFNTGLTINGFNRFHVSPLQTISIRVSSEISIFIFIFFLSFVRNTNMHGNILTWLRFHVLTPLISARSNS